MEYQIKLEEQQRKSFMDLSLSDTIYQVSAFLVLVLFVITPSSLCSVSKPFLFLRLARRRSQHSHARGVMPLTTGSQIYVTVQHFAFLSN